MEIVHPGACEGLEMKRFTFISIVFALLVVGCTESQRQRGDRMVEDVNNVTAGAQAVLQSPVGQMIPSPGREIAALAVALATSGVAAWQTWRKSQMAKTTKAIIKGVEQVERRNRVQNPNPATEIKQAIGVQMRAQGIYDAGNKIVDRLKIT